MSVIFLKVYTNVYTILGVSCFLYSHTGSPEPSGEYSTYWLTLFRMPKTKANRNLMHRALRRIKEQRQFIKRL